MKDLLKGNLIPLLMGSIIIIGLSITALQAMPWATKEQVKTNKETIALLIMYRQEEQTWYNDFRERLARIEENGKNISKDLDSMQSDLKDHQRNHHN